MENFIIFSENRIAAKLKFPLRDFIAPIKSFPAQKPRIGNLAVNQQ